VNAMSLPISNNLLTYEQFITVSQSIKDNTGYNTEYSNGEVVYFSHSAKHSRSIFNIVKMLDDKLPNTCLAISELHIKFKENEYRIPDISVFCGKDIKGKFENDLLHLETPKGIEEYLLVDYRTKTIEQYYLQDNSYILNKKYENDDVCKLLLYPHIKFITGEVFQLFMQG
jgi:Uma2 family endonuclease